MEFKVMCKCQIAGRIYRAEDRIEVDAKRLQNEIDLGVKKVNGKDVWMSGMLRHCVPDQEASEFLKKQGFTPIEQEAIPTEEQQAAKIKALRKDIEALDVGVDMRWGEEKLKNELIKAKKIKGV